MADESTDPKNSTWVALFHEPGAGAPRDESLFQHPTFGQHLAFLERMRAPRASAAAVPIAGLPGGGTTKLPSTCSIGYRTRCGSRPRMTRASPLAS